MPARTLTVEALLNSEPPRWKQAQRFATDLQERKTASNTEVIGRAPVESEQALRGLDAATAADRILDVLLQIPEERERTAMVAEAFVPPTSDGAEVGYVVSPIALSWLDSWALKFASDRDRPACIPPSLMEMYTDNLAMTARGQ